MLTDVRCSRCCTCITVLSTNTNLPHQPPSRCRWDELFCRIAAEGFGAVETIFPVYTQPGFKAALDTHGLRLIACVHTTAITGPNGEYLYCTSNKLADHKASFKARCDEALAHGAFQINSHSGHDSWDTPEAVDFFKFALALEAEYPVEVSHETHRQRQLFNPCVPPPMSNDRPTSPRAHPLGPLSILLLLRCSSESSCIVTAVVGLLTLVRRADFEVQRLGRGDSRSGF
jgi:hypothetical protein